MAKFSLRNLNLARSAGERFLAWFWIQRHSPAPPHKNFQHTTPQYTHISYGTTARVETCQSTHTNTYTHECTHLQTNTHSSTRAQTHVNIHTATYVHDAGKHNSSHGPCHWGFLATFPCAQRSSTVCDRSRTDPTSLGAAIPTHTLRVSPHCIQWTPYTREDRAPTRITHRHRPPPGTSHCAAPPARHLAACAKRRIPTTEHQQKIQPRHSTLSHAPPHHTTQRNSCRRLLAALLAASCVAMPHTARQEKKEGTLALSPLLGCGGL